MWIYLSITKRDVNMLYILFLASPVMTPNYPFSWSSWVAQVCVNHKSFAGCRTTRWVELTLISSDSRWMRSLSPTNKRTNMPEEPPVKNPVVVVNKGFKEPPEVFEPSGCLLSKRLRTGKHSYPYWRRMNVSCHALQIFPLDYRSVNHNHRIFHRRIYLRALVSRLLKNPDRVILPHQMAEIL